MHNMMKVTEITGFGPPKVYDSDDTTMDCFPLAARLPGLQHMLLVDMDVQTRRIANKKADGIKTSHETLIPIVPGDSSDDEVYPSSDCSSSDALDPVDHSALEVDGVSDVASYAIDHSTLGAHDSNDPEPYNGPKIEDGGEDEIDHFKEPEHAIIRGQLREVVSRDAIETPQTDMVRFVGLSNYELPSRLTWKALDGLRPRHLELECGYSEECRIAALHSLKTQWPLESIAVSSGTGVELDSLVMESISSLTLYLCCSMTIPSAFGAGGSLRRLVILENDALDMFVKMSNSGVTDPVQELVIASTIGCDLDHDPEELFKAMSRCSALRSLDLAISVSSEYQKASDYARLLAHLPDTLEHFRFWGQPGMAENMNHWLECALDPKWLPNLKSW